MNTRKPFDPMDYDAIRPFFAGKKFHKNYDKCVDMFMHMDFHITGYFKKPLNINMQNSNMQKPEGAQYVNPYFTRLIDMRRPNESDTIRNYRRNVFKPQTKAPTHAVMNSLEKIFKAQDYHIDYSKTENPKGIPLKDQLEKYCEKNLPYYDSVTTWAEAILLRWDMVDPNALCAVMPKTYEIDENELYEPLPHIICSTDVYEFVENDHAIFKSPNKIYYTDKDGNVCEGKIVCIVTTTGFYEATQVDQDNFTIELKLEHNIGTLPVWILGGEATSPDGIVPFYESYLSPMLPDLDEMAAVYSDKQAELIQHMYSIMWYIIATPCKSCNASGYLNDVASGKQIVCPSCDSRGVIPHKPYQDMIVNTENAMGEKRDIPIPPAGYIEKDTKIIEYLNDEIAMRWKGSLCAVKMPFLYENPLSKEKESGLAKSYDQSETNVFVQKVASKLVRSIQYVYYYINEIRYYRLVPDVIEREKMLPIIDIPREFDIVSSKVLEENMKTLAEANVSSIIKNQAAMDYLHAKYPNGTQRDFLQLEQDFDPFVGKTVDEKMSLSNSGAVDKKDIILSLYINDFITNILNNDQKFIDLPYKDQRERFEEMAQKKLDMIKASQPSLGGTQSGMTMSGGTASNSIDVPVVQLENPVEDVSEKQNASTPGKDESPSRKDKDTMTWS